MVFCEKWETLWDDIVIVTIRIKIFFSSSFKYFLNDSRLILKKALKKGILKGTLHAFIFFSATPNNLSRTLNLASHVLYNKRRISFFSLAYGP